MTRAQLAAGTAVFHQHALARLGVTAEEVVTSIVAAVEEAAPSTRLSAQPRGVARMVPDLEGRDV